MRRRVHAPTAGGILQYVAPEGSVEAVWAAFEAWDADLTAWELTHPEHAAQVAAVRDVTVVPDQPWDPSWI